MNQSTRMQKLAGLVTENTDMEEAIPSPIVKDPLGKVKQHTPGGGVGTEFKPATTTQAFATHLLQIAKELRSGDLRQKLQTAELVQLDTLLNKMLTVAKDVANKGVDMRSVGNFAASKFK